jgi:hypothetical protein
MSLLQHDSEDFSDNSCAASVIFDEENDNSSNRTPAVKNRSNGLSQIHWGKMFIVVFLITTMGALSWRVVLVSQGGLKKQSVVDFRKKNIPPEEISEERREVGELLKQELVKAIKLLQKIENNAKETQKSGPSEEESFLQMGALVPTSTAPVDGASLIGVLPPFDTSVPGSNFLPGLSNHSTDVFPSVNRTANLPESVPILAHKESAARHKAALVAAKNAVMGFRAKKKSSGSLRFQWVSTVDPPNVFAFGPGEHEAALDLWGRIGADAVLLDPSSGGLEAYNAQFKTWQEALKEGEELTVVVEDHHGEIESWIKFLGGAHRNEFAKKYPHLANPRGLKVVFLTCAASGLRSEEVPGYRDGKYYFGQGATERIVDEKELAGKTPDYSIFMNSHRVGGESLHFPLDHGIAADIMQRLLPYSSDFKDLGHVARKTLLTIRRELKVQDIQLNDNPFLLSIDRPMHEEMKADLLAHQHRIEKLYEKFFEKKLGADLYTDFVSERTQGSQGEGFFPERFLRIAQDYHRFYQLVTDGAI